MSVSPLSPVISTRAGEIVRAEAENTLRASTPTEKPFSIFLKSFLEIMIVV